MYISFSTDDLNINRRYRQKYERLKKRGEDSHNISGNNKMKCEIRSTTESNLITKYERCFCNKINRNYNDH